MRECVQPCALWVFPGQALAGEFPNDRPSLYADIRSAMYVQLLPTSFTPLFLNMTNERPLKRGRTTGHFQLTTADCAWQGLPLGIR